jgi:hypothetical protein
MDETGQTPKQAPSARRADVLNRRHPALREFLTRRMNEKAAAVAAVKVARRLGEEAAVARMRSIEETEGVVAAWKASQAIRQAEKDARMQPNGSREVARRQRHLAARNNGAAV